MKNFELTDALGLIDRGRPFEKHIIPALITAGIGLASSLWSYNNGQKSLNKQLDAATQNTRETNEMNYRIAHENNDTAIQLQREMNDWNLQQWNRNNEYNEQYNSTSAQLQRWMDAGLNPNGFNGSNGSVNMATPVQQLSTPNLTTPTMQNSADAYIAAGQQELAAKLHLGEQLGGLSQQAAQTAYTAAATKREEADAKNKLTDAKVRDYLAPSMAHLNWMSASEKNSHIQLMTNQCSEVVANVDYISQQIQESKARVSLMSEEESKLYYENMNAPERWAITDYILSHQAKFNEEQLKFYRASFLLRLGYIDAQKDYLESLSKLTDEQKRQVELVNQITSAQYPEDVLKFYKDNMLSIVQNEKLTKEEQLDALEYSNGFFSRSGQFVRDLGTGIGAALNGAASVKGKSPRKPRAQSHRESRFDFSELYDEN